MDFFEAQDQARGLSRKLVALYGVAVLALIVGVYLVVVLTLGVSGVTESPDRPQGIALFDPFLFAVVALGMGTMIGLGTAFRTAQLRKGGSAVAELLGGRRVDPRTTDPAEQQLLNVVEEMAIASGVPVPEVFVMDRETGINAFAAGHTLNDAAVAVTRGALDAFNRDELQGVMAHEFSHILNGDMRLNIRLMGLLFGILLLTVVGRGIVRGGFYSGGGGRRSGNSDRGGGQIMVVGIALVVLGYLGVLAGRLIQAAVSRQREYLADAAAVQFTRNPEGIANALKRIGAASDGSRIQDHHAEEASHLFFARGTRKAMSGLTSTHPPLPRRIRRIDPSWDGSWELPPAPPPRRDLRATRGQASEGRRGAGRQGPLDPLLGPMGEALGGSGGALGSATGGAMGGAMGGAGKGLLLGAILGSAGTLGPSQVAEARRILSAVPDEARTRLRTPEGALEGVVALLLHAAGGSAEGVEEVVNRRLGPRALAGGRSLVTAVAGLPAGARLPVLELALPGLRGLPRERAAALLAGVAEVVEAGLARGEGARLGVDPFLVAMHHLVRRNLPSEVAGEPGRRRGSGAGLERHREDSLVLLDLLARAGSDDEAAVTRAREAGIAALPGRGGAGEAAGTGERLTLERVEAAITSLEGTSAGARRTFLEAAAAVVESDAQLEVAEAELLRALAEALEVPLPPLRLAQDGGAGDSPGPAAEAPSPTPSPGDAGGSSARGPASTPNPSEGAPEHG